MQIKIFQDFIDIIRGKKKLFYSGIKISNNGVGNIIKTPKKICGNLSIVINGNNNSVIIDNIKYFQGLIYIGTIDCNVNNSSVYIGEATTSNGIILWILEDDSKVHIGENCMFSSDIYITCSDHHTIIDAEGNIQNIGKNIHIGNNVWVGRNVTIGKNVSIGNNSVVGMSSVVTSKTPFPSNCVIAGNPAKVVKENINWSRLRPKQWIAEANKKSSFGG